MLALEGFNSRSVPDHKIGSTQKKPYGPAAFPSIPEPRAPDAAVWYLGTAALLLLGLGDGARWPRKASPIAARM
jgi:hypothetical protein